MTRHSFRAQLVGPHLTVLNGVGGVEVARLVAVVNVASHSPVEKKMLEELNKVAPDSLARF